MKETKTKPKPVTSILTKEVKNKNKSDDDDMFSRLGGFKPNTSFANLKQSDQVSHTIFNQISNKVLANVKTTPKSATELREIIINSFNPMSALSKLLQTNFKKLFKSELFAGILISLEAAEGEIKDQDIKKDFSNIITTFKQVIATESDESSIKLFACLCCKRVRLLEINKTFKKIQVLKEETEKFLVIGEVLGLLIKLLGVKNKNCE